MKARFRGTPGIESWSDLLAMSACYALVIGAAWMITHRPQFAAFVMGLLP